MRQRNTTGADLFVQGDPAFVLAPDEVVDHEHHIPGCEPIDAEPVSAIAEVPKIAAKAKAKVTETGTEATA